MTKEQKEIWLAALRSGKYKQGKDCLNNGATYCCLGVANEVCNLGVSSLECYLRDTKADYLFLEPGVQLTLGNMNDHDGLTFDEIADYIELNVEPTE